MPPNFTSNDTEEYVEAASDLMKFYSIRDADDMMDFFKSIVFPFVYEADTIVQSTNYPVGDNFIRITMRFIKGR